MNGRAVTGKAPATKQQLPPTRPPVLSLAILNIVR